MNRTKEKTPTGATVSDLKEKSFEENSLTKTILPQDERDFFAGLDRWYAEHPVFEWGVRTA